MSRSRRSASPLLLALITLSFALATPPSFARAAEEDDDGTFGVLVMAHGGTPEWNRSVEHAVADLAKRVPLSIAFGMADATTIEQAVTDLEQQGVERIGVVRLFISGASWLERTEQILGLEPGAPAAPSPGDGHHGQGHGMAFHRISATAEFALSVQGLSEAPEVDSVVEFRARTLSVDPPTEDVLILAHGVGDDEANERWRSLIGGRTLLMRRSLPFRRVLVETLAEDWEEPRRGAEERVRTFVAAAGSDGGRAIVIPFRLSGFGPYAEVLEGLEYTADGVGLLPHAAIARWIERQALELEAGPFRRPLQAAASVSHHAKH